MKKTILLSYAALLVTFVMAWCVCAGAMPAASAATVAPESAEPLPVMALPSPTPAVESPAPDAAEIPEESAAPAEAEAPAPSPAAEAAPGSVRVLNGGEVSEMAMQEYLVGVVAAEMPAGFNEEALKAQAVAARSYTIYCAQSGHHAEADVCTDSGCCQAWISEDAMRENWGESFEENYSRVAAAVEATDGQYLAYDGKAIFAAFHSSSAGKTESCGAIWSDVPYLVSVDSPEDGTSVPNYVSTLEVGAIDFRDAILRSHSGADFSGDESEWVQELRRDESGRVSAAVIGGAELSGTELRELFSLRSACFTLEYTGTGFLFTVTGFGHGVGMSQYGAQVMAASGSGYEKILAHYYTGAVLVK